MLSCIHKRRAESISEKGNQLYTIAHKRALIIKQVHSKLTLQAGENIILLIQLQQLCQSERWRSILHPYMHIDGLMFAVAAAPEIPMPDTWLPWVVKNSGEINSKDADELTSLLLALLKHRLAEMRDETFALPKECGFDVQQSNISLKQWLMGLMIGHQQLESVWLDAWKCVNEKEPDALPDLQRNLSHCLRMFSTFAEPELAIEQAQQRGNSDLAAKLPVIFQSFPKALKQYVDIAGLLVSYMPNQFEMYEKPLKS